MRFGLWPIDATYVKYSTYYFMSQVQYNIHITVVNYYLLYN